MPMKFIPYNKNLKEFSQQLRQHSTKGEVLLWNRLKQKQLAGYTFNRQKPLGNYIVDFYCKPLKLVIEIDGASHHFEDIMVNDVKRQQILEELGLSFLRFTESQVRFDLDNVIWEIEKWVEDFEDDEK